MAGITIKGKKDANIRYVRLMHKCKLRKEMEKLCEDVDAKLKIGRKQISIARDFAVKYGSKIS